MATGNKADGPARPRGRAAGRRRATTPAATPSKGRARRERNADETRARILEAATAEFARKGYDGARLRDVAEAAGVHHALLHHYFGDKEGLFRAVVERAFAAASSRAFEALRSTHDVQELTERYVETLVEFYAENPYLVQILHFASLDEGSPAYAQCEEIGRDISLPLLQATAKEIRRAQKAGAIRDDIEAERLVAIGMGAVAYVFNEARFFSLFLGEDVRSPAALAEHKKAVLRVIVDGILRPTGGG
ncbi:MAG: TetR/AcrR family transcriptional regulator [Myxococcota bacterium]